MQNSKCKLKNGGHSPIKFTFSFCKFKDLVKSGISPLPAPLPTREREMKFSGFSDS
jgi:hypothetical protein